jgi:pyridoxamine 5'-phosphate oxidase-like protein
MARHARKNARIEKKQPAGGRNLKANARPETASAGAASPRPGRPNIPGYGIVGEKEGGGLLPWSWAEERLIRGWNYWITTTRPDGRPHLMPVWGLWREGAFWFSTGEKTVKARNLAANPNCVVAADRADEAVIVEGRAEWVPAGEPLKALWVRTRKNTPGT